jgi:hypothetical protein
MKNIYKSALILVTFLLFSCDNEETEYVAPTPVKNEAPAQVANVLSVTYDGKAKVSWDKPADTDIHHYDFEVQAAGSVVSKPVVALNAESRWVLDLTNGVSYSIRIRAVDEEGLMGNFSTAVSFTPTTGMEHVTTAEAQITANNNAGAVTTVTNALTSTTQVPNAAAINALHGTRAKAYYNLAGGQNGVKTDANYVSALADLDKTTSSISYALKAVIGGLVDNYAVSVAGAEHIYATGAENATTDIYEITYDVSSVGLTLNDVFITAAWSAYLSARENTSTAAAMLANCQKYLDFVEILKDHSTDPDELFADLQRLNIELYGKAKF